MRRHKKDSLDLLINGYFAWLCKIVKVDKDYGSYNDLLLYLFNREFTWDETGVTKMDYNRAGDGEYLREKYCQDVIFDWEKHFDLTSGLYRANCLEVLISIAERMDFMIDKEYVSENYTDKCFWELIENLGLDEFFDDVWDEGIRAECEDRVSKWLYREYDKNGVGGIFPLRRVGKSSRGMLGGRNYDQRRVEIWYQMQTYMMEKEWINEHEGSGRR